MPDIGYHSASIISTVLYWLMLISKASGDLLGKDSENWSVLAAGFWDSFGFGGGVAHRENWNG